MDREQEHPEIISRFKKGDPIAFEKIYQAYHYTIYGFANYYLENVEDAEDITSETFVKLWNRCENFESLDNIIAFLRITTRNACLDFLKARKRQLKRTEELKYLLENDHEQVFDDYSVKGEVLNQVLDEIEKLPKKTRRVVHLTLKGLKSREIARELHVSVQTVMNQKASALKVIRTAILARKLLFLLLLLRSGRN